MGLLFELISLKGEHTRGRTERLHRVAQDRHKRFLHELIKNSNISLIRALSALIRDREGLENVSSFSH